MRRLVMACGLALSMACGRNAGPTAGTDLRETTDAAATGVTAVRVANGVRITNGTDRAIPYVVWDLGFLGLLGSCDDSCPLLRPGESVTVKIGSDGFGGIGPAVLYWWPGPQDPYGAPDPAHSMVVP